MSPESEQKKHPTVTEHPEQRRQQETGREDASETGEVGRPPSGSQNPSTAQQKPERAA